MPTSRHTLFTHACAGSATQPSPPQHLYPPTHLPPFGHGAESEQAAGKQQRERQSWSLLQPPLQVPTAHLPPLQGPVMLTQSASEPQAARSQADPAGQSLSARHNAPAAADTGRGQSLARHKAPAALASLE